MYFDYLLFSFYKLFIILNSLINHLQFAYLNYLDYLDYFFILI